METYNGHVRTPADAIILFEACRLGLLPRVQRRLSEKERQSIKSGSVFVWDEREAGMRRWTDGKSWSASRVSGSFLTYREMEGKRGGGGNGYPPPVTALARPGRTPDNTHGSESDLDLGGEEGPDGYRYKPDGLVKQSFSITTSSGSHLHLISYYSRSHPASQHLNSPSTDPALRQIRPTKGMYPESTVHEHQSIPAVTRSPMASAPYTTVPQMAGYARQGPPQWPQHQNYGYPQTPQQHPQPQYYGYQYAPGPHTAATPSSTNVHSPLQYSQPAQYPASRPPDRYYSAYDSRPPPSVPHHEHNHSGHDSRRYPPTPADNRPPQSLRLQYKNPSETRLPHPHQGYPMYTNGAHEAYPPSQYDSQRYPARQPPALDHSAPPAQHPQQYTHTSNGVHHSAVPSQTWNSSSIPPPHANRTTPPSQSHQSQQTNPSNTPIDPQLMGPTFASRQQSLHQNEPSRTSTPLLQRSDMMDRTVPQLNGYSISTASTIPSINALMNGSSAENHSSVMNSIAATNGHPGNGYNGYMPTPPDKKSPTNSTKGKDGPQDIPNEKVGFREDVRAIKVLDRAFRT